MAGPLSKLVESAAYGIARAVLDKADEVMTRDVKANDAKTDPGLLARIRERLKAAKTS